MGSAGIDGELDGDACPGATPKHMVLCPNRNHDLNARFAVRPNAHPGPATADFPELLARRPTIRRGDGAPRPILMSSDMHPHGHSYPRVCAHLHPRLCPYACSHVLPPDHPRVHPNVSTHVSTRPAHI